MNFYLDGCIFIRIFKFFYINRCCLFLNVFIDVCEVLFYEILYFWGGFIVKKIF